MSIDSCVANTVSLYVTVVLLSTNFLKTGSMYVLTINPHKQTSTFRQHTVIEKYLHDKPI